MKIRKPVAITKWFGIDTSSEESEEDESSWSEVDYRKKRDEKKRRQKKRKLELKSECARKASCMVTLGPVSMRSIDFFRSKGRNFEDAKCDAVKEFLQFNLEYNQEELDSLQIIETRISVKGDNIINVALSSEDEVREIYYRKAELRNEDVTVRGYIPPNFHARFIYLSGICAEKRAEDPRLKRSSDSEERMWRFTLN